MRVVDANQKTWVDLLIESINDQNKSCYTHVVDRNQNSESASMTTHSIQQRIFYYLHLLRFISIHDIDDNSKMICIADRMKHVLYVSRELNIYYMFENTKIWAETHSSLNIWSWIERVCLNDKNSESASKTHSILISLSSSSLDSESAIKTWTEQALLNAINAIRTSSVTRCRHKSEVSLLQWHRTTWSDFLIELIIR